MIVRGYANASGLNSQTVESVNSLTETGVYKVTGTTLNVPVVNETLTYAIEVIKASATVQMQRATIVYAAGAQNAMAGDVYVRTSISDTWRAWKKVTTG